MRRKLRTLAGVLSLAVVVATSAVTAAAASPAADVPALNPPPALRKAACAEIDKTEGLDGCKTWGAACTNGGGKVQQYYDGWFMAAFTCIKDNAAWDPISD